MKKKLKIKALDVILWFYITGFIALCVSMPWIRQRLPQRTPSPTPTAAPSTIPTSTPVPTVMAENTPVPSPLPTSTPVPQVEFDKTILADAGEYYRDLIKTLYDNVDDVVPIQLVYVDGNCYLVVIAKINGKWQIVELSQG